MREKPGLEKPNTSKKSAEESAPGLPASGLAPTASYGTPGTTRTYDLRIRSPKAKYRLTYSRTFLIFPIVTKMPIYRLYSHGRLIPFISRFCS